MQWQGPGDTYFNRQPSDHHKPTGGKKRRLIREFNKLKADLLGPIHSGCSIEAINEQVNQLNLDQRIGLIHRMDQGVDGLQSDLGILVQMRARILLRQTGTAGQHDMTSVEIWNDTLLNVALRTRGRLRLTPEQRVVDLLLRFNQKPEEALTNTKCLRPIDRGEIREILFTIGSSLRNESAFAGVSLAQTHMSPVPAPPPQPKFSPESLDLKALLSDGKPLSVLWDRIRGLQPKDREEVLNWMHADTNGDLDSLGILLRKNLRAVRESARAGSNTMPSIYDLWTQTMIVWSLRGAGDPILRPEEIEADKLVRAVAGTPENKCLTLDGALPAFTRIVEDLRPRHLTAGEVDPAYSRLNHPLDNQLVPHSRALYQIIDSQNPITVLVAAIRALPSHIRESLAVRKHFTEDEGKYGLYDELVNCARKHLFARLDRTVTHYSPEDVWKYSVIASALRTIGNTGNFALSVDQQFVDNIIRLRVPIADAWKQIPPDQRSNLVKLNPLGKFLYLFLELHKKSEEAVASAFTANSVRTPIEEFVMRLAKVSPNLKDAHSRELQKRYSQNLADAMAHLSR